ncbi:MAG TPA: HAD hydrolase family protein [Polyangiales bacterium]|nr:HAD hydrolase family protein [Polyangiales bacterium]
MGKVRMSRPNGKQALPAAAEVTETSRLRPIREFDPAACQALAGVVFDVDDTVTRGGTLEEAAFSAMFRLREAGLKLVAVTGRPLGFAELMARMWPIDLAVGENGAGHLRLTAAGVQAGFYASPEVRAQHAVTLARLRERVAAEAPWAKLTDDSWARRCDVAWDVGERVQLPAAQIEVLRGLIEASGASCLVSSVHAHAHLGGYDKATGVVRACKAELGANDFVPEHWLFIGDSGNDAAAFAYFPLSAGVANVREHLARLPVPPRYVSEADRGSGFAEIAKTLLEHR